MKIKEVKQLYPNAITSKTALDDNYLSLVDGDNFYNILKADLSESEINLLNLLFNQPKEYSSLYKYLHADEDYNGDEIKHIQAIHFKLNRKIEDAHEWLNSFSSFFEKIVDKFFIDDFSGAIFVEKLELEDHELIDIIGVLEEDYSININVYVGLPVQLFKFKEIYLEEHSIFNLSNDTFKVASFRQSYIDEYVVKGLLNSPSAKYLRDVLLSQAELKTLIKSLWDNQGNQSAVAKELYVHRNTITYRLDKLFEDYQINLRDMEQLFLCYLLIR